MAQVDLNIPNFPSNSKTRKVEDTMPERRVETIVKGEVKYKPSLSKKFRNAFFGEEVVDVKSYIFDEIVVPGIKGVIADIFYGFGESVEMALFGRTSGRRGRYSNSRNTTQTIFSYDKITKDQRRPVQKRGGRYDDLDIILNSRAEGEAIVNALVDLIDEYGMARVADLNVMLNRTGDFIDNDWGWTALGTAKVVQVRGGYLLDLPRPISLK